MIGLGRMGANMTLRLARGGHRVVGFDPRSETRNSIETHGAESADSLDTMVTALVAPRTVWMMVPAGDITDGTVTALLALLAPATPSSMAAIPTTKICSTAPSCARTTSSTTSTAAPVGACGDWRRAIA